LLPELSTAELLLGKTFSLAIPPEGLPKNPFSLYSPLRDISQSGRESLQIFHSMNPKPQLSQAYDQYGVMTLMSM